MNRVSRALVTGLSIATAWAALAGAPAAAGMHTVRQAPCCQPDLRIGSLGNDIYNSDGTNQTKHLKIAPGKSVITHFQIENDGSAFEHFTITGASGAKPFGVSYSDETDANITTDMEAGYDPAFFGPTTDWGLRIKIKVAKSAKKGKNKDFLISASSNTTPSLVDAIIVSATVK